MTHLSEDQLLDLAQMVGESSDPHLEGCAACQERLRNLRHEQRELRELFALEAPLPAGLQDRVGARVQAAISAFPNPPRRSKRMKRLAAAAVIFLTAGACTWFAMSPTPTPPDEEPEIARKDGEAPGEPRNWEKDLTLGQGTTSHYAFEADPLVMTVTTTEARGRGRGGVARMALALDLPAVALLGTDTGAESPAQERYGTIVENAFRLARSAPLSTFSIDVDRASYANTRRYIENGQLPPADAVRVEELLNYFAYQDPAPANDAEHPVNIAVESASCPWTPGHRLVRIALKGKEMDLESRPGSNLVFLLDVSGSMNSSAKLPLVKKALRLLVNKLDERDTISIVVYAGAAGQVLPPTSGLDKETIHAALQNLEAGGSTNGGAGIELAYAVARESFIEGGINRVILCTDGDFNVGVANTSELTSLIEEKARGGVFLSLLGFGTGNLNDELLESLSNRGNGMYAYIDSFREAAKIFSRELLGSLWTIAKDVKLQIEFNPAHVGAYRLIGYENRMLAAEDFNDDTVDAGELGAGHSVCALYEIAPPGEGLEQLIDSLKYSDLPALPADPSPEMLTVKLRYKAPDSDTSVRLAVPHTDAGGSLDEASEDLQFNAAVAAFGLVLRGSRFQGSATLGTAIELADGARSYDPGGDREAFVGLARQARKLLDASPHEIDVPGP